MAQDHSQHNEHPEDCCTRSLTYWDREELRYILQKSSLAGQEVSPMDQV